MFSMRGRMLQYSMSNSYKVKYIPFTCAFKRHTILTQVPKPICTCM